ncbi:alanine dehydrogenase [Marinobacterium weihaiense]|uniref:Alanine dehydrogenase n=1 Tax=Marinobacterium weihaiense TaxID=2851016 RepID=A0ABS6MAD5_9GAMM|nr:alanine dehydrogenase [Marinobacterium weihaiense]MBV0933246.1 alanine dehydrogenase [Marinobacterium weihaiense]
MRIGVPREIKNREYRVGMTPMGVRELVEQGHQVQVEQGAGVAAGFGDQAYEQAGAVLVDDPRSVFSWADLIVKVKEPQPNECGWLSADQVLFTYLHLAADRALTDALLASGCTAIGYETVTDAHGGLPLLAPMSEVAGRMAVQAGAHCLEKAQGGRGVLLGGVPGVSPARVLVIGGGVVGENAVRVALGMGARVVLLDKSLPRLRQLDERFNGALTTLYSTTENIEQQLAQADLVIGAVLLPGAAAPKLVTRGMLASMQPGAVLVDVAIDQGGCFETSHPTTHDDPVFEEEGVVHYCVANMPGAVARTATLALTNATLPYVEQLAAYGWRHALQDVPGFAAGLNIHSRRVTCAGVAEAFDLPQVTPAQVLGSA